MATVALFAIDGDDLVRSASILEGVAGIDSFAKASLRPSIASSFATLSEVPGMVSGKITAAQNEDD